MNGPDPQNFSAGTRFPRTRWHPYLRLLPSPPAVSTPTPPNLRPRHCCRLPPPLPLSLFPSRLPSPSLPSPSIRRWPPPRLNASPSPLPPLLLFSWWCSVSARSCVGKPWLTPTGCNIFCYVVLFYNMLLPNLWGFIRNCISLFWLLLRTGWCLAKL